MNEFVERLKQRESTAWAELYDRHIREIYGYVFHLVGGIVRAELANIPDLQAHVFWLHCVEEVAISDIECYLASRM